jgi:hypothetical protein
MKPFPFLAFIITIFLLPGLCFSQTPNTSLSEPFEMPLNPLLIQTSGGKTLLMDIGNDNGLKTIVFDNNHKIVASPTSQAKLWEPSAMKHSYIRGVFQMHGKAVIFLEQASKTRKLLRIEVDPATGVVTDEALVAEIPVQNKGMTGMGNVVPCLFYVEKDEASDCYAVVLYNPFARKDKHRIELIHFNSLNQEVNRQYYERKGSDKKYQDYVAMSVNGDKEVFLCTYDFDTRSSGGVSSQLVLSKYEVGKQDVQSRVLKSAANNYKHYVHINYLPENKQLQLMLVSMIGTKNTGSTFVQLYSSAIGRVDATSLNVLSLHPVSTNTASLIKHELFNSRKAYKGLPTGGFINTDNSISLVMEEDFGDGTVTRGNSYGVALVTIDETGEDKDAFLFRHSEGSALNKDFFSMNDLPKGRSNFDRLAYLKTSSGAQYVFFYEKPENFGLADKANNDFQTNLGARRSKTLVPMYYKIVDGKGTEMHLLENGEKQELYPWLSTSNFDATTNTYAMLVKQGDGRNSNGVIAWLKLD